MDSIIFHKMSSAGNDFIMIDTSANPKFNLTDSIIRKLCDRHDGIGADGVILLSGSEKFVFEMDYFNADGSTGSLCGNGARCAIKFASDNKWLKGNKLKFLSNGVEYSGEVLPGNEIKFNLNPPSKIKYNFKVKAFNQLINAHFADTGSPHVVIKINEILIEPNRPNYYFKSFDNFPIEQIGREIRYLPEFAPGGTNVNFVLIIDGEIHMRTYERGVESETLSCGTGSAAAAIICNVIDKLNLPITIITKRNEKLFVNFEIENQRVNNLSLSGPAKTVFTGSVPINFF